MTLLERTTEVDKDGNITAGVFIPIPAPIAKQFPDKSAMDDSPPHVTLLFVGDITAEQQSKLVNRVRSVLAYVKPFRMDMTDYGEFTNAEGQKIPHMSPTATHPFGLNALHALLWRAVEDAGIPVGHRYGAYDSGKPDAAAFKSHATLAYLGKDEEYDGPRPTGSWNVTSLEVWGHDKVKIPLGTRLKLDEAKRIDLVPGGKGDKLQPKDVDPEQLRVGIAVELEHTKDRKLAQEIALDHLAENPKYYTKLKKIEPKEIGALFRQAHERSQAQEARDLPSKYASVMTGLSGRTGVGTAPMSDPRPEQERRDLKRRRLRTNP